MARFEETTMKPLIDAANGRIDKAIAAEDITERTDSLLSAREENGSAFARAARRQLGKIAGAGLAGITGLAAAFGGYTTATSLVAVLAGTTGFAIPLAIAGFAVFIASAAYGGAATADYDRLKNAWNRMNDKADNAVSGLVKDYPAETSKSSKLAAFLKRTFNPAASAEPAAATPAPAMQAPAPLTSSKSGLDAWHRGNEV